jgi:hypothetical protein
VCLLVCALMQFHTAFSIIRCSSWFHFRYWHQRFWSLSFPWIHRMLWWGMLLSQQVLKAKVSATYIGMGGWWVVAGTEATSWRKITTFSGCYFAGFFSSLLLALCACIGVCVVTRLTNVRKVSQSLEFPWWFHRLKSRRLNEILAIPKGVEDKEAITNFRR